MSRSQTKLVDAHVQTAISTYGVPPELYGVPDTRKGPSWKSSFPEIKPLEPTTPDLIISTYACLMKRYVEPTVPGSLMPHASREEGDRIIERWLKVTKPLKGGVGITLDSLTESKPCGERRKGRTLEELRDPTISNIALRDLQNVALCDELSRHAYDQALDLMLIEEGTHRHIFYSLVYIEHASTIKRENSHTLFYYFGEFRVYITDSGLYQIREYKKLINKEG